MQPQRLLPVVDGFGPGLHDKELVGDAVLGPLDVHRHAVVFLNQQAPVAQLLGFGVGEHEQRPLFGRRIGVLNALA